MSWLETQLGIAAWADNTFGQPTSNARVAARANEEMAELIRALTENDKSPKAGEEMADVIIIFCRLATRLGLDLQAEIERKMNINRQRVWNLTTDGHGYHVRERSENELKNA